MFRVALILLNASFFVYSNAALIAPQKQCGNKFCTIEEYCSKIHNQCESCDNICKTTSHNFDQQVCSAECQEYLQISSRNSNNYEGEFLYLKQQQQTVIILLSIIFIVILLSKISKLIKFIRWLRSMLAKWAVKKNKTWVDPATTNDFTQANPHVETPKVVKREIDRATSNVLSISGAESTAQTLTTPISTRHPAENSTLEYSYDNAGLQLSNVTTEQK